MSSTTFKGMHSTVVTYTVNMFLFDSASYFFQQSVPNTITQLVSVSPTVRGTVWWRSSLYV